MANFWDILSSALTGAVTGNPLAYQQNKFEQLFKQQQLDAMREQLSMQRDMHELEKRKADLAMKYAGTSLADFLAPKKEVVGNQNVGIAGGEEYAVPTGEPTIERTVPNNNPTQEDVINALFRMPHELTKSYSPLITALQSAADREEARQDRLNMFALNLAEKQAAREQNEQLRREAMAQAETFHRENMELRRDLSNANEVLRKRVPPSVAKDMAKKISDIDEYLALADEFKDEYAGDVIGGPFRTDIYERLGLKKERVNWWKRMKNVDSLLRHERFAGSLTKMEKKLWDAITITENTSPEVIRTQLRIRADILRNVLQRELESYAAFGYDVKDVLAQIKAQNPELPINFSSIGPENVSSAQKPKVSKEQIVEELRRRGALP